MVVQRRLAAILAADVAGYTRLMGEDEEGTLSALTGHRTELIEPCVAEYNGRIVKTMGDGLLAEFASVVDAVRCAVSFQQGMLERNSNISEDKRITFRVGVNLGDVIVQRGDVYGDGVNVAARLEALADPGGVVVSGKVHDEIRDKLSLQFTDLGPQQVKNIVRPIPAFAIQQCGTSSQALKRPMSLPDKPSIAVLPFENMSGDPEQEYFADGMAEDIITALSRCHWFFVIARNSTFTYKGKAIDVRQVGNELGVRYVLEGSVRRAGERLRITAQLVEAVTGKHLWAEKFDGALADVFELQDRITEGVVGAIEPSVRQAEIDRARQKKPENLDAYDLYLRALPHVWVNTAAESTKALAFLDEALKIDPSFAALHGLAALCHMLRSVHGNFDETEQAASLHHARAVLAQTVDDSNALSFAGIAHAILAHDFDTALNAIDRAIALNPNSARAFANWGFAMMMTERNDDDAMSACQRAIRLSPFDPLNYGPETAISIIHYRRENFGEALEAARRAIQISASFPGGLQMAAASYVRLDRLAEARDIVHRLLEFHPRYRLDGVRKVGAAGSATDSVVAALREAGVPD